MKNLKLTLSAKYNFPNLKDSDFILFGPHQKSDDLNSAVVYVLKGTHVFLLKLDTGEIDQLVNLDHIVATGSKLVYAAYSDIYDQFWAFYSGGELHSFSGSGEELKSEFADGIFAAGWSYDQDTFVIVTETDRVLVLTPQFDLLHETHLHDDAPGERTYVNVGWGRKETQFHGSEGKNAAVQPKEQVTLESFDFDRRPRVTWKGDSSLFAVTYFCPFKNFRRVKIFSRDGLLQCCSEDISGFDGPIDWRPSANLISLTERLPNKYVVAFMEKNGLKHGEFTLPSSVKVTHLNWNQDSTVLLMRWEHRETKQETATLWTTGNYHWYCKQSFEFKSKIVAHRWDEQRVRRLFLILADGTVHVLEFSFLVDHSTGSSTENFSYVSVIDDNKVLLTPFAETVIPPPMCKFTLECPDSINQLLFRPKAAVESPEFLCAVLKDGHLCFFSDDENEPKLTRVVDVKDFSEGCRFEWSPRGFLRFEPYTNGSTRLSLIDDKDLKILSQIELNHLVITATVFSSELIIQTSKGQLFSLNYDFKLSEKFDFPLPCPNVAGYPDRFFGLSDCGRLHMNSNRVATNVTSFSPLKSFVLATTSHHTLLTLKPLQNDCCEEVSSRKLENGSKIVIVSGHSVIFQLPRGNLETIQPRSLVLVNVGHMLDQGLYLEAVQLLRKQRISTDLCVDHDPINFINRVKSFVEALHPDWISLFVTLLQVKDVTRTIYSQYYDQKRESLGDEKVKKVCDLLLQAMSIDKEKYMLPILSCLVKTNKMSEAIDLAKDDARLEYLTFLVPVEKLYSEALGAYNLEAALKIAGKSQMDPKEYVVHLNNLRKMDGNYMKFYIDKSLQKYVSALNHLSKCGDKFEEFLEFMTEHNLYSEGLRLCDDQPQRYEQCANRYGEFLTKNRFYEESGVMYLRSRNIDQAIESFIKAGNWRRCLTAVKLNGYSDGDVKSIADRLYRTLMSSQLFGDAGFVCLNYLSDEGKAVDAYIRGQLWEEALHVAFVSTSPELLKMIIPQIESSAKSLLDDITSKRELFGKYLNRLGQVRYDKVHNPVIYRDFDEMSETSSVASTRSRQTSTSKSSRMTKKAQKKLWSLKEGNPREEQALVAALSQIISGAAKTTMEVKNVCSALVYVKDDDLARKVQSACLEWVTVMTKSRSQIWPKNEDEEFENEDFKYSHPPDISFDKWELSCLKL